VCTNGGSARPVNPHSKPGGGGGDAPFYPPDPPPSADPKASGAASRGGGHGGWAVAILVLGVVAAAAAGVAAFRDRIYDRFPQASCPCVHTVLQAVCAARSAPLTHSLAAAAALRCARASVYRSACRWSGRYMPWLTAFPAAAAPTISQASWEHFGL
jgi:hypothetical protein